MISSPSLSARMYSQNRSASSTLCFPDRAFLPSEPQHLWQVERGLIRTYTWDSQGDITTLGIWGSGEIVGQSLSNLSPYTIQCLGTVEVRSLMPNSLITSEAILSHAQQLTTLLKIISIKRADDRLLNLLQWLAQRFGHVTPVGTCTTLPITHQELAETANITRVTATRLIGSMEQQGILQWSRRRQFILLPTP
ncbi:Crp/Fnr family transcriptional regulator [Acaryochloris sp. IP29b_bin.137]|uniref:Crp/Fnr family transcriptional regulator n=1 Tax=Acaryochloris sp. IP29b_bin.137 TaxID=2969217 RepID=UPI00260F84DB|nr:Crp/Fnr family transcriptional regulator [Acaryochloris sp. IP29b_bin.137]